MAAYDVGIQHADPGFKMNVPDAASVEPVAPAADGFVRELLETNLHTLDTLCDLRQLLALPSHQLRHALAVECPHWHRCHHAVHDLFDRASRFEHDEVCVRVERAKHVAVDAIEKFLAIVGIALDGELQIVGIVERR